MSTVLLVGSTICEVVSSNFSMVVEAFTHATYYCKQRYYCSLEHNHQFWDGVTARHLSYVPHELLLNYVLNFVHKMGCFLELLSTLHYDVVIPNSLALVARPKCSLN